MNLLVDQKGAQEILNYLASKPWNEVYKLIPHMINLKPGVEVSNGLDKKVAEAEEARKLAAEIHDHTNEK
jgi:hypothetical protein